MKSNNTVGAVVGAMIVLVLIGGSIWYTQNYPGADSATTSTSSTTINTPRPLARAVFAEPLVSPAYQKIHLGAFEQ